MFSFTFPITYLAISKPNPMRKLFILFVLALRSASLIAQSDLKSLDVYYTKALADWDVPGMSIAIVKDGNVVFSKGYGVKEVGKSEKPDENTLFAIASNTKAFTTAAIAMMVEEGKLSLDDKVRKFLPYFELYSPYVSQDITVRDLLCHRVGYSTFIGDAIWYLSDDLSAEQIIRRAKYLPQSYNLAGKFIMVPRSRVTPITTDSADIMAMIVSGGVSGGESKGGEESRRESK